MMQLAAEIRVLWWWWCSVCITMSCLVSYLRVLKHTQWMLFFHSKLTVEVSLEENRREGTAVFRRVRIVVKSALLPKSCPSVRMSACISSAPTGQISLKFGIGDFHEKSVEQIHFCLIWGKNIGHFTRRPKYVILLPTTLNRRNSAVFEWNGINVTRTRLSVSFYSSMPMLWRLTGTLCKCQYWTWLSCALFNATAKLKTLCDICVLYLLNTFFCQMVFYVT
jgi:hypothetical protein